MKIIAFNGSPRKDWNTATLLKQALAGAAATGAQTELINLYDLSYKGCYSCFACKNKDGANYGTCPIKDELLPIFKKIENADAIIMGSPIYIGRITGEMQSFLERLLFQYITYTNPPVSLFPKKITTGFIYTMGVPEESLAERGYSIQFTNIEQLLTLVFGSSEKLLSFDTHQFDIKKNKQEVSPLDCQKAFDLGARLVRKT